MKRAILLGLCSGCLLQAQAQQFNIKGTLADTAGNPVAYATAALLDPKDSTMRYYGISGTMGVFMIANVAADSFLLQLAGTEYQTYYQRLAITGNYDLGKIILKEQSVALAGVTITSDKLPLLLKGDTVEYNAGAYKTRPGAAVEELLKKLPGVEVDRAGNVKAQGKAVQKVTVDGKEFFSNDPKIPTKNLPADAVKKVQVFDRKSDAAQFSGIDDGQREKTINLELKEGKRSGYFGSLVAGGGSQEHYKLDAKLYRFRKNSQFALLGMLNDINEFGFSLDDYMSFLGGPRSFMDGNGNVQFRMSSSDNLPVNFGQSPMGLISSGAGGINYSYEPKKNRRIGLSYLGNGSNKQLGQQTETRNFSPGSEFTRSEQLDEYTEHRTHRFNLNTRMDPDSATQLSLNGNVSLLEDRLDQKLHSASFIKSSILNSLESRLGDQGSGISAGGQASFSRKWKGRIPVFRFSASSNYRQSLSETDWMNLVQVTGGDTGTALEFRENRTRHSVYGLNTSFVIAPGKGFFIEPRLQYGSDADVIDRKQGAGTSGEGAVDSLSPAFTRTYSYVRPGISLQRTAKKSNLRLGLGYETGWLRTHLEGDHAATVTYTHLVPSFMWRKDMGSGKNLEISYNSEVQPATAEEMLPVPAGTDPLQRFTGNSALRPEYQHQVQLNYLRFDQFSLTSLFFYLSGRYITDKVNWSRNIMPDLTQQATLVNVPDDYLLDGRIEYTTPVRKAGLSLTGSLEERYQQGINFVNGISNQVTVFTHSAALKAGNRKKNKWDLEAGLSIDYTDARYSIQRDLNNRFYNTGCFAELSYRPSDHWFFMATADVSSYRSGSFEGTVTIPLLKAEASYSFLKYNRGTLSLNGFDLLQSNKGLERISELNYLMERRSNIIGQYFMLSFRYRLSKAGPAGKGNVIMIGK